MTRIGIILGSTRPNRNGEPVALRAVEHLRTMAGEVMMADVRAQVVLPFATEFENYRTFKPGDYNLPIFTSMLDQVIAWSQALASLRAQQIAA